MKRVIFPLICLAALFTHCVAEPAPEGRTVVAVFGIGRNPSECIPVPPSEGQAKDEFEQAARDHKKFKNIPFDRVLPSLGPGLPLDVREALLTLDTGFTSEDLALYYPPYLFVRSSPEVVKKIELEMFFSYTPSMPGTEVTLTLTRRDGDRSEELLRRMILCRYAAKTTFKRKLGNETKEEIALEVASSGDQIYTSLSARFHLDGGEWHYKGDTHFYNHNPAATVVFQAPEAKGNACVELSMRAKLLPSILPQWVTISDAKLAEMAAKISAELSQPAPAFVPSARMIDLGQNFNLNYLDYENPACEAPASLGGGPVYNIRKQLIEMGIPLAEDDVALLALYSGLTCIRTSRPGVLDPGYLGLMTSGSLDSTQLLTQLDSSITARDTRRELPTRKLLGSRASLRANRETIDLEAYHTEPVQDIKLVMRDLQMGNETWSYDGAAMLPLHETKPQTLVSGTIRGRKTTELSAITKMQKTHWGLLEENPEQAKAVAEELLRTLETARR